MKFFGVGFVVWEGAVEFAVEFYYFAAKLTD